MALENGPLRPLNIVIVGGSLAGLIHGVVLHDLHHNVTILERSIASVPENRGAGLAVATDLKHFMSTYDATGLPYSVESQDVRQVDSNGTVVKNLGMQQTLSSWECIYYRLRANFDGLCSEYVPNPPERVKETRGFATYKHGMTVQSLQESDGGKVLVEYTDQKGRNETLLVDLVVAADGANSTVRQMYEPTAKSRYTGCIGWRGTTPEIEISRETKDFFGEMTVFCQIEQSYIISYFIPGRAGEVEREHRLRNWVWYHAHPSESPSYKEVMTANDGRQHRVTVPIGKVQDKLWLRQKKKAFTLLDPHSAELVSKTTTPFVQALTDVIASRATFLSGKVVLVGDALATFRPMTGQSTNQAARNAMDMREWLMGRMTLEEWERRSLQYAMETRQLGARRAKDLGIEH